MEIIKQFTTAEAKLDSYSNNYEVRWHLLLIPVILLPAGNLLMLYFAPITINLRIFILSIIGAVAEELFFRGLLLKILLLPRIKPKLAIILVSLLFALFHLLNLLNGTSLTTLLPQILCAICFSIWAGAVVWRKNSILIPLLAHVLLNLSAITEGTLFPMLVSIVVLIEGILLIKDRGITQ